ncbi:DUF2069 domain-containing protein [Ramlibacter sp. PS4R-6]|uniref:DUF2069 domain-containing protein n=1 Tax=Ramlibacter sp. PS4R-6 TaxID=3133438 RepID=UPI003099BB80
MQSLSSPPAGAPLPVEATRWSAVLALLALIALSVGWEMWIAPIRPGGSPVLAAVKALPLCIPLAGLLRRRMYTYRWLSLLVWLYFAEGVVRAWSETGISALLALLEIALTLVLFTACALHVRLRLKSRHEPIA